MRVDRLYIGFQSAFALLIWLPVFFEYQLRQGITEAQFFQIQSVYYFVFCLFEVPTGYLSDRLGHRRTVLAGGITLALANFLPILWTSFNGFLLHFVLIALARSFVSGAASAYLFEWLKQRGETHRYQAIEGHAHFTSLAIRLVSWPCAGLLMAWHLTLPYWITTFFSMVAVACAASLPRAVASVPMGKNFLGSLRKELHTSSRLIVLMLQGTVLFVLMRILFVNLYQPIMKEKLFDIQTWGLFMSMVSGFEALGAFWVAKRTNWTSRQSVHAVFALSLLSCMSVSFVGESGQIGTIVAFSVFGLCGGVLLPIQKRLLNEEIRDGSIRATVLSLESIVNRVAAGAFTLFTGSLVASGNLAFLLNCAALSCAIFASLCWVGLLVGRIVKGDHTIGAT